MHHEDASLGNNMSKRNITILGLLAVITMVIGGVGFALAQDTAESYDYPCDGTGPIGLMNGYGFWSQLTDEQATLMTEQTQAMYEAGASHDEIMDMRAALLQEWGIDAPLWSGPHNGGMMEGYGRQYRDGSGSGQRYGGRVHGGCGYTN